MRAPALLLSYASFLISCDASSAREGPTRDDARELLVGGPCEGCEAVFEGRPTTLTATTRIAPASESGEPMTLEGVVRDPAGKPVAGVIVYAYHTDAKGLYPSKTPPKNAVERHGLLRAFAKTGTDGVYRFETIRPGSYPDTQFAAHVHMHVVEPGRCHYFIDDVVFTDDPKLTEEVKKREHLAKLGGSGVTTPVKTKAGWLVKRDIALGANVHDYARCKP